MTGLPEASEAMQTWLALEHEAVWLYPIIGARFDDLRARARTSFEAHRDTRDALLGRLETEPVATLLSYDVGPLKNAKQARAAAQDLEERICAACLSLTGLTTAAQRTYAVKNLTKAALAALTWDADPKPFPGLP